MLKKRRVVVTGLGVVSPIGNSIDEFWKSLLEGRSGVKRLVYFDPAHFTCKIAAEIKNYDPSQHLSPKEARRMDRFVQFAVISAKAAMADAVAGPIPGRVCRSSIPGGSSPSHSLITLSAILFNASARRLYPNPCHARSIFLSGARASARKSGKAAVKSRYFRTTLSA